MIGNHRILIVDDSRDLLDTFNDFFNSMGYQVSVAPDGFEALKLLRNNSLNHFNLLITDLVMPQISGVGLITIIKKEFPDLKIIAMTGYGNEPGLLATEAQADLVLYKPLDLFKMEKNIAKLLKINTKK